MVLEYGRLKRGPLIYPLSTPHNPVAHTSEPFKERTKFKDHVTTPRKMSVVLKVAKVGLGFRAQALSNKRIELNFKPAERRIRISQRAAL